MVGSVMGRARGAFHDGRDPRPCSGGYDPRFRPNAVLGAQQGEAGWPLRREGSPPSRSLITVSNIGTPRSLPAEGG